MKYFEEPDLEADRQALIDYFFNEFLPDDARPLDEDEEGAREAMFNNLAELAKVLAVIKRKH